MDSLTLNPFGGPGGWDLGALALGLPSPVGIETDAAACATRQAAGLATIRYDVTDFPADWYAGQVRGLIASPVCTTFSAAGKRAGVAVTSILAEGCRDALCGLQTRGERRREMAAQLSRAWWPDPKLTRSERSAAIWKAVRSASLVIEPARFIWECRPEWVTLEQVPAVLPLWQVYAAELRRMGYNAWTGTLNSADYGVPQTRIRAILIASKIRQVRRPEPTHYDARKGDQLWGEPWISMAEALGWGASGRPSVAVTAGGTETGGAEPFGHRGREALEAERDAGRWALKMGNQPHAAVVPSSAPGPTMAFGHNAARMEWVLHTNRDQRPDGSRQTVDPSTAKSGGQWVVKAFRNSSNNNNACERSIDEPAGTLFFGQRSNWAAWVTERPATTVQGDPLVGRPGHKNRDKGERQFEQDSVRITVEEAAVLQSFPAGYPFQGTKTARFRQVGDAMPPLFAAHVLSMATGIPLAAEERAA